jgi:hypothetical protein
MKLYNDRTKSKRKTKEVVKRGFLRPLQVLQCLIHTAKKKNQWYKQGVRSEGQWDGHAPSTSFVLTYIQYSIMWQYCNWAQWKWQVANVCAVIGMSIVDMCWADKATLMLVIMLPGVKNEQPLFLTVDLKPCKRCSDWRKLSVEWTSLVAARVVFINAVHEIKESISDTLRIIIIPIPLYNFPRKSPSTKELVVHPLPGVMLHTLETTALHQKNFSNNTCRS